MKFVKGKIKVRTSGEGIVKVDGFICRELGIHKPYSEKEKGYNITHLKSGMSMCTEISSLKKAKIMLERIIKESGVDWRASQKELFETQTLCMELHLLIRNIKHHPFENGTVKKIKKIKK